ncbi:PBP1A family penicillin-binding protein [Candidatus Woesebacteria bacterium]|nr:PBP1A family penicillin-binding protein [Candidatus Woesebacteria bacterium]
MWKERARMTSRQARRPLTPSGRPPASRSQRIAKFVKIGFIVFLVSVVVAFVGFQVMTFLLPAPENIVRHDGFSTKILDRNGKLLYDVYVDQRRSPVTLSDIPEYLKKGTIAIEDKNFYTHQGFDPLGYLRIVQNLITRQRLIGGSTLTQQLVKNVLLTPERTAIRKIKELILTLQIEKKYSKDEILTLYLNEAPYGGSAYGAGTAAEIYFGKSVKDLNLVESAFLAGLPQRPPYYSPYLNPNKAYIGRTQEVLRRMREDSYITKEQEQEARTALDNLEFQPKGADFKAPHFVQYVQNILNDRYGEETVARGGLKVTTTLDLDLQEKAQAIVSEEIEKVQSLRIGNGAAVAIDPQTGEILAMVGSKDFNAKDYDGQVNVTTSLRQPGSAIKPIVYTKALEKGYTAASVLVDSPTSFPGGANQPDYVPVNYDGKFRGPVQLRYALANSLNIPAVKMISLVGVKDVLSLAYDMGLSSLEPTAATMSRVGLSLALGGGEVRLVELTSAYSAFLNQGYRVDPVSILEVQDQDGKVLEKNSPKKGNQVIPTDVAYIISNILSDNDARKDTFGLNSLLNISGRAVAVKTGTTNDRRDNWAIGGTPQVIVGTWVGNNDNSPMKQVASGVSGASPIWNRIVKAAVANKPVVPFDTPSEVTTQTVDRISGLKSHDGFPDRTEYFVKGTEPGDDTMHVNLKVCKGEGKLATPSDVAANNYENKEFIILKEEDPTAPAGGENKWQKGIIEWINSQPDNGKYKVPTEYCSGVTSAPLNIDFVSPTDRSSNLDKALKISFKVSSLNNLSNVWLEVDGTTVRSFTGAPYEFETELTNGVHTLRAVVKDDKGNQSDRKIQIGVGTSWDSQ